MADIFEKKPLPVTPEELGGKEVDFIIVTGDAYVDHPSFGTAIIGRCLEAAGFSVAVIPQPEYKEGFKDGSGMGVCRFSRPRLAFLVNAGNIDSMVAHYTASKKRRNYDYYSPGGVMGKRPDRAVIVYCNRIREAYGDVPIIIGGLEASLRRFAHYDYWDDKVRRSILIDSRADILSYGMGERSIVQIAKLLDKGVPIKKIRDVLGTCICAPSDYRPKGEYIETFSYDELKEDKEKYRDAFMIQYNNTDHVSGKAVIEFYDNKVVVQNPPQPPLSREELDAVYELPFTRRWHPIYDSVGGVPAINEVEFSITHNRGCFGACAFCALAYHQGRCVTSRSIESVVKEAKLLTTLKGFKGYIHDVGGPTANFRYSACKDVRDGKRGVCTNRRCLSPTPCKNLIADHSEYVELLRNVSAIDGIKKVFIRSGIRFDYLMADKNDEFFRELVKHHVSGQLKVAPEHVSANVLKYMGKPNVATYNAFCEKYYTLCKKENLEQYLVPYLMSSHPGSTLKDALELALYLKKEGLHPEQVQDFYPTPATASTTMFYTGYDPFTKKKVYVPRDYEEKLMQRALLQYGDPKNRELVEKALKKLGREDLIGNSPECLIRPIYYGNRAKGGYAKGYEKKQKAVSSKAAKPQANTKQKAKPIGKSKKR